MKLFGRLTLAFFFFSLFCGSALAGPAKIGIVDMEKFRKQSLSFQRTYNNMKKKADSMQAKLDQEKKALERMEQDFEKQKLMLSLDAQGDKQLALEKKKRYYKYLFDDFSFEMKAAELETQKRIGKVLNAIVRKIGAKESFTLIMEKRAPGLIYYDNVIDITDKVVQIYDKENP